MLMASPSMFAQTWETGNYYLKNVESGRFLAGGNSWGTQASLIEHGEYVTLHKQDNGTYQIESRVSNGGTNHFFNGSYMDNGSPINLTFTHVEGNKYTMSNGTVYYGYDETTTVLASNLTATDTKAQWEVISEADMKASLDAATFNAPMDATFFIKNHNFGRNHRDKGSWTIEASNKNLAGGDNTNCCAESYHSTFTLSQALTGVPNGVYALTAQGFYRQDGSDNNNLPYFFANDAKAIFPLKTGSENSMSNASASFTEGRYQIEPIFVEVTDGALTVGAKLETNTSLWCIWDHFALKYYGDDYSAIVVAGLLEIPALKEKVEGYQDNEKLTTNANLTVKTAIGLAEAAIANPTDETVTNAIAALNNAIVVAEATIATDASVIAKLNEFKNNTAFYSEQGLSDFENLINAYENGTLTEQLTDPYAVTGHRANICYDDFLMSAWTINGEPIGVQNWNTLHVNSWSTEGSSDGSNFVVPFYEYWTGDGNSLGATSFVATVKTPYASVENYKVTATVRVRLKNGGTAPTTGITLKVGEGAATSVTTGNQIGTSQFYMADFDVYGVSDANGNLSITFDVADDNNISWFSFQNISYEKIEKSAEQIALENALEASEAVSTDNLNQGAKDALTKAIEDANAALTQDKAAMVAATEALNVAMENAKTVPAAWQNALGALDVYKAINTNSVPNDESYKTDYSAAISTAETVVANATTAANINNAIATLELARQTYVQNAYPTEGYSFDMTFLMKNPAGDSFDGWNKSGNAITIRNNEHWSGVPNNYFDTDNWSSNSWSVTMTQDVTLPRGIYTAKAAARASTGVTMKLIVNDDECVYTPSGSTGGTIAIDGTEWTDVATGIAAGKTFARSNAGYGWTYGKVEGVVSAGTLTVKFEASAGATENWCSFDDFQLLLTAKIPELDYSALESVVNAINLGFDDGEYAPYNNIASMSVYNQTQQFLMAKTALTDEEIKTVKDALEAVTWTPNEGEVNAIFDGSFVTYTEADNIGETNRIAPKGWTNAGSDAYRVRVLGVIGTVDAGLAATSSMRAVMMKQSTTYGEVEGYELPLDADTEYSLELLCGGWNEGDGVARDMSVKAPDGTVINLIGISIPEHNQHCEKNVHQWRTYYATFKTSAAGNYILNFSTTSGQDQLAIADLKLYKKTAMTLSDKFVPMYAAAAGLDVQLSRTFKAGYNTVALPFATTPADFGADVKVYTLNAEKTTESYISMSEVTELVANTPYILYTESAIENPIFNNVDVVATGDVPTVAGDWKFHANYTPAYFVEGMYGVSDNSVKKGVTGAYVNGMRGWFEYTGTGEVAETMIRFDGENDGATSINGVEAANAIVDVYTISGQLVKKAVKASEATTGLNKGLYIVGGEKVLVK